MEEKNVREKLDELRHSIDNLDAALVHLMAERFKLTSEVGRLKAEHKLPASDPKREQLMMERLRSLAVQSKLDPDFTQKLIRFVIDEVVRHHKRVGS